MISGEKSRFVKILQIMFSELIAKISKNQKVLHVFLLMLLYLILDFEYRNFVVPLFSHLNFSLDFQPVRMAVAILIFLITLSSLIWMKTSQYLHATSVLFIVFLLIPNLILFQYMETDPAIPVFILLFIIMIRLRINLGFIIKKIPVVPSRFTPTLLVVFGLIFLLPIVTQFGFSIHSSFSFSNSSSFYEIRNGVNEQVSILSSYSFGQLTKAILPVMVLYGIACRKYLISVAGLIGIGYIFMVNPHKTYLIAIFPILFFAIYQQYPKKITLFLGLFILLIFTTKIFSYYGNILPESLTVRRSLFTQAFLTHAYFDFFKDAPIMLSHSFLGKWICYPHSMTPPFLIGDVYFNSPVMSCNNGIVGDGFMNFGYWGSVVFLMIGAAVFHFINNLKINPFFYGLTFLIIFQMQNGSLFTLFATHGLLLLMMIMLFLLRRKPQEEYSDASIE